MRPDSPALTPLLSLADAQARLLRLAPPLPLEQVGLALANGRWLATPVAALVDHPFADLSAMDGYAIRFDDLPGPWRVTQEIAAGTLPMAPIEKGEAARIFTGAPVPEGADAILLQEEAVRHGEELSLSGGGPPAKGAHIRRRGANFRTGEPVLTAGERLTPARIGVAAMAGHAQVAVRRRPRVTLLSTGDELALPGVALRPGQLFESNGPMLAALLAAEPAEVKIAGVQGDQLAALTDALAGAAAASDILVTTGGASVGDHDLVRPALQAAGATIDFWKVAMKPGKPLMAGRLGPCVVLGLPGNPVSAFVTATLFLKPLIALLGGAAEPLPKLLRLPLAAPVAGNGARLEFLRAVRDGDQVRVLPNQDSGALPALAAADTLVLRPAFAPPAAAGAFADVLIIA